MLKNIILSLILFSVSNLVQAGNKEGDHPFHASVTELIYNAELDNWEMSVKIFTNDLENALKRNYNAGVLNLGTDQEDDQALEFIQQYIQQKIKISIDGTPCNLEWVGKEGDMDAIWIYIQAANQPKTGNLKFSNLVLSEVFENQENIVHLETPSLKKTFYLGKKNKSFSIDY